MQLILAAACGVAGRGEAVHDLAHGGRRDSVVLAELGERLRAAFVQVAEHGQGRVAEPALGAFAAESASLQIQPVD